MFLPLFVRLLIDLVGLCIQLYICGIVNKGFLLTRYHSCTYKVQLNVRLFEVSTVF